MLKYIVTGKQGLYVRAQMDTTNAANIKRKMSNGEGFTVYQTYVRNGNQLWGRVSTNPGLVEQEYVCLQIANKEFARAEEVQVFGIQPNPAFFVQLDAWARSKGYNGIPPFS